MTRLYFRDITNATSGLPTTEQSSLTADASVVSQATNKTLSRTKGTAPQTSILNTSLGGTSQRNYYFCRFVSEGLSSSSIAANTWTYNFCADANHATANFPVSGTNQPVRVNIYVWRPSNSSKVGTILDGNTASGVDEPSVAIQTVHHVTFTGAAVSSIQPDDVICFEVWFVVTQSGSPQFAQEWYYDGATENTTKNSTTPETGEDHASFIETPETLSWAGDQITMTQAAAKTYSNKFITKV